MLSISYFIKSTAKRINLWKSQVPKAEAWDDSTSAVRRNYLVYKKWEKNPLKYLFQISNPWNNVLNARTWWIVNKNNKNVCHTQQKSWKSTHLVSCMKIINNKMWYVQLVFILIESTKAGIPHIIEASASKCFASKQINKCGCLILPF